jgi:hypothetical protein
LFQEKKEILDVLRVDSVTDNALESGIFPAAKKVTLELKGTGALKINSIEHIFP